MKIRLKYSNYGVGRTDIKIIDEDEDVPTTPTPTPAPVKKP
jgi:hypothetical protein